MMITGSNPCYPNGAQGMSMYEVSNEPISSSIDANSPSPSPHPNSFLYNLSILKDKVHQIQSIATIFLASDQGHPPESTAIAIPTMGTLIQEVIVTASSMMFACQQMALGPPSATTTPTTTVEYNHHNRTNKASDANTSFANPMVEERGTTPAFYSNHHHHMVDHHNHQWYGDYNYNSSIQNHDNSSDIRNSTPHIAADDHSNEIRAKGFLPNQKKTEINVEESSTMDLSPKNVDIVELDAADLLAKYTHYCQVCGKGFKRDANLRMHMRAHGDEYKSSAALSNPMKNKLNSSGESNGDEPKIQRKYSCPHEGCRWNQKHAKFQPLKSMICVKNHYKRSHCPKMYVCKRCNRKQFSVLSDLRTHEKHCGDLKWQCSCGTTFSRKDKLMGHVTLFIGHTPAINSLNKMGTT